MIAEQTMIRGYNVCKSSLLYLGNKSEHEDDNRHGRTSQR